VTSLQPIYSQAWEGRLSTSSS